MDKLESHLPPQPRAWALCETYLEQFSWWFRPIKREELIFVHLLPPHLLLLPPPLPRPVTPSARENAGGGA